MSDNDKRGGGNPEGPNTGVVVKPRPEGRGRGLRVRREEDCDGLGHAFLGGPSQ